jgi:predicted transcriptional regulator
MEAIMPKSSYVSEIEKAKSAARAAQRKEQRKATLPITKPVSLGTKEYIAKLETTKKDVLKQAAQYEANTVLLDTGERVSKLDYDTLNTEQQSQLKTLGISGFLEKQKQIIEQAIQPDLSQYTQLDTGEYILTSDFVNLDLAQQSILKKIGVEAYNQQVEREGLQQMQSIADFNANNIKLNTGEYINKDSYNKLTPEQQNLIMSVGVASFNRQQDLIFRSNYVQLPSTGEYVDKAEYMKLPHEDALLLDKLGLDAFNAQKKAEYEANYQAFYNSLPEGDRRYIDTNGLDKYKEYKSAEIARKQAVLDKIKDYITVNPDGTQSVDIVGSIQGTDVTYEDYEEIGITREQIAQAYYAEPGFNTVPIETTASIVDGQTVYTVIPPRQEWITGGYTLSSPTVESVYPVASYQAQGIIPAGAQNIKTGEGKITYTLPAVVAEQKPIVVDIPFTGPILVPESERPVVSVPINVAVTTGDTEPIVQSLKTQGYNDTAIKQIISEAVAENTLAPYKSIEDANQYDITGYLLDNGITSETIKTLTDVGYSGQAIATASSGVIAANKLKPYQSDLAQYIRDNPEAADLKIFQDAGIPADVSGAALQQSRLAPNYGDFMVGYLTRGGLTQEQAEIYAGRKIGKPQNVTNEELVRINSLVKNGYEEYMSKYGAIAAIGSEIAIPISFVLPAARALAPDVELSDISGAEWATTAGMAASIIALPFGGITGGIIGKAIDIGASAAFATATALEWDDLSTTGKIWAIGGNLAFLVLPLAVSNISKIIKTKQLYNNPRIASLIRDAGKIDSRELLERLSELGKIDDNLLDILETKTNIKGLKARTKALSKAANELRILQDSVKDEALIVSAEKRTALQLAQNKYDKALIKYAETIADASKPGLLAEERALQIADKLDSLRELEAYQKSWLLKGGDDSQIGLVYREKPYYIDEMGNVKSRMGVTFDIPFKGEVDISDTKTAITAADIKLAKKIKGYSEGAVFPYTTLETPDIGISSTGKPGKPVNILTPTDRMAMERTALESAIAYYKKTGITPLTSTLEDLQRKLRTMNVVENKPLNLYIPLVILRDAIRSDVIGALDAQYNISPSQAIGAQPITQQGLIILAERLNITSTEINQAIQTGNLQKLVVLRAIQTLPASQAQLITQAIVSTYPETAIEIGTIPQIIEWQQVSQRISPEAAQEVTPAQLSQIQQAQQTIAQVNQEIAQQVSQQASVAQQQRLQQAQQALQQIAQQVATQSAIGSQIPIGMKPPEVGQLIGKEKPPRKIPFSGDESDEDMRKKREAFKGAICWKQGIVWHAWKYPYESDDDLATFYKYPPEGAIVIPGAKKAQETIQMYLGDTPPPPDRKINMGIMDIYISSTPDGQLIIKYEEDKEQSAGSDSWFGGKSKKGRRKTKKHEGVKVANSVDDNFWSGSV